MRSFVKQASLPSLVRTLTKVPVLVHDGSAGAVYPHRTEVVILHSFSLERVHVVRSRGKVDAVSTVVAVLVECNGAAWFWVLLSAAVAGAAASKFLLWNNFVVNGGEREDSSSENDARNDNQGLLHDLGLFS